MPAFKEFPLSDAVDPVPGEPLRYMVRSRTNPRMKYLVDLAEAGFNGACGCPSWQMLHLPLLKRDRRDGVNPRPKRRCWHIQKALEFHAEISIRIVARHREKTKNEI